MDGLHLIAGQWTEGDDSFESAPAFGPPARFHRASAALVHRAATAAEAAFETFAATARSDRAAFLETAARQIDRRGEEITAAAMAETGLPEARLVGERGRTCGQLRLFAEYIRKGDHLGRRHDPAQPDRTPQPRPDLRLVKLPIGPVAVFGASNFPLAFSVAGGDTASALAAGCPVVVKGHPAHPRTGELVAEAMLEALIEHALPFGTFSFLPCDRPETSQDLVAHPLIQAVGFTGSHRVGRLLFDRCAARPTPIPFFGELGSINPVFLLPDAVERRGDAIAAGWAASLTLGAGQFCTNPGVAVAMAGAATDRLIDHMGAALAAAPEQTMLTDGVADHYRRSRTRVAAAPGVNTLVLGGTEGRAARADLFRVSAKDWIATPALAQEVFGPLGILVEAADAEEMLAVARALEGQLTCTLHVDPGDHALAARLALVLRRKCGRLIANGFPTGVEVAHAMAHGGPYPASTNFGHTSVGSLAINRWLRPVCFQDAPDVLLPADWPHQPSP